jgi:hypothetical protein
MERCKPVSNEGGTLTRESGNPPALAVGRMSTIVCIICLCILPGKRGSSPLPKGEGNALPFFSKQLHQVRLDDDGLLVSSP